MTGLEDGSIDVHLRAFPVSHEWLRASMNVSQSTCAGSMALWFPFFQLFCIVCSKGMSVSMGKDAEEAQRQKLAHN